MNAAWHADCWGRFGQGQIDSSYDRDHLAMISVRFGVRDRDIVTLGPAQSFLLSGDVLCIGPLWYVAAVYRGHAWEYQGRRFVRLEFLGEGMTLVDFDDARAGQSGRLGPCDSVLLADGVLFVDDRPFAKLAEETFVWNIFETGASLRNILIEPDRAVGPYSRRDGPTILGRPRSDGEVDHRQYSTGAVVLFPGPPAPTDADDADGEGVSTD
jgi:hypothetical protein